MTAETLLLTRAAGVLCDARLTINDLADALLSIDDTEAAATDALTGLAEELFKIEQRFDRWLCVREGSGARAVRRAAQQRSLVANQARALARVRDLAAARRA